jgi:hypothetical protein
MSEHRLHLGFPSLCFGAHASPVLMHRESVAQDTIRRWLHRRLSHLRHDPGMSWKLSQIGVEMWVELR